MAYRWLLKPSSLAFLPLALLLVIAVACGPRAGAPTPTRAAPAPTTAPAGPAPTAMPTPAASVVQPTGKYGGVLPLQIYGFPKMTYSPHGGYQIFQFGRPMYNALVEYDPTTPKFDDIKGDLAKSWDLSEDGLTWTFHLQENARWHDGTPVTAEDVVYSMDRMVDPKAYRPTTRETVGAYYKLGNTRAIDPHTVAITTPFPAPDLLGVLAMDSSIIAAKHWQEPVDAEFGDDEQPWEKSMGSGPFKPGKIVRDVSVELVKNKDYWKEGLPYLDGLKHLVIIEKGTIVAAYKTGQVLMSSYPITNLNNREVKKLDEESPEVTGYFTPANNVWQFHINSRRSPLNDQRVRQAINLAVHRQPIMETHGIAGVDLVAPPVGGSRVAQWWGRTEEEISTLPGYRELNGKKHPDDIAKAKSLLKEAGYPDGFKTSMDLIPARAEVAQVLADQLKEFLNVTMELKIVDVATLVSRINAGDVDLFVGSDPPPYLSPDAFLFSHYMPGTSMIDLFTGWLVPEWFQDAVLKQSRELDQEKRLAIIRKLEDYLINEDSGPYVMLFWEGRHHIVNNRVKGFNMTALTISHLKFEHLWCDPRC